MCNYISIHSIFNDNNYVCNMLTIIKTPIYNNDSVLNIHLNFFQTLKAKDVTCVRTYKRATS